MLSLENSKLIVWLLRKPYSPFLIIAIAGGIQASVAIENLQIFAAIFGMLGIVLGLTVLAYRQYQQGKIGVPLVLNTLLLTATCLRFFYLLKTNQYWLMSVDAYGMFIMVIIQLQFAGYFLKKPTI